LKVDGEWIDTRFGLYRRSSVIVGDRCDCGGVFIHSGYIIPGHESLTPREYWCSDCGLIKRTNDKLKAAI
jgi:hypothetical protein